MELGEAKYIEFEKNKFFYTATEFSSIISQKFNLISSLNFSLVYKLCLKNEYNDIPYIKGFKYVWNKAAKRIFEFNPASDKLDAHMSFEKGFSLTNKQRKVIFNYSLKSHSNSEELIKLVEKIKISFVGKRAKETKVKISQSDLDYLKSIGIKNLYFKGVGKSFYESIERIESGYHSLDLTNKVDPLEPNLEWLITNSEFDTDSYSVHFSDLLEQTSSKSYKVDIPVEINNSIADIQIKALKGTVDSLDINDFNFDIYIDPKNEFLDKYYEIYLFSNDEQIIKLENQNWAQAVNKFFISKKQVKKSLERKQINLSYKLVLKSDLAIEPPYRYVLKNDNFVQIVKDSYIVNENINNAIELKKSKKLAGNLFVTYTINDEWKKITYLSGYRRKFSFFIPSELDLNELEQLGISICYAPYKSNGELDLEKTKYIVSRESINSVEISTKKVRIFLTNWWEEEIDFYDFSDILDSAANKDKSKNPYFDLELNFPMDVSVLKAHDMFQFIDDKPFGNKTLNLETKLNLEKIKKLEEVDLSFWDNFELKWKITRGKIIFANEDKKWFSASELNEQLKINKLQEFLDSSERLSIHFKLSLKNENDFSKKYNLKANFDAGEYAAMEWKSNTYYNPGGYEFGKDDISIKGIKLLASASNDAMDATFYYFVDNQNEKLKQTLSLKFSAEESLNTSKISFLGDLDLRSKAYFLAKKIGIKGIEIISNKTSQKIYVELPEILDGKLINLEDFVNDDYEIIVRPVFIKTKNLTYVFSSSNKQDLNFVYQLKSSYVLASEYNGEDFQIAVIGNTSNLSIRLIPNKQWKKQELKAQFSMPFLDSEFYDEQEFSEKLKKYYSESSNALLSPENLNIFMRLVRVNSESENKMIWNKRAVQIYKNGIPIILNSNFYLNDATPLKILFNSENWKDNFNFELKGPNTSNLELSCLNKNLDLQEYAKNNLFLEYNLVSNLIEDINWIRIKELPTKNINAQKNQKIWIRLISDSKQIILSNEVNFLLVPSAKKYFNFNQDFASVAILSGSSSNPILSEFISVEILEWFKNQGLDFKEEFELRYSINQEADFKLDNWKNKEVFITYLKSLENEKIINLNIDSFSVALFAKKANTASIYLPQAYKLEEKALNSIAKLSTTNFKKSISISNNWASFYKMELSLSNQLEIIPVSNKYNFDSLKNSGLKLEIRLKNSISDSNWISAEEFNKNNNLLNSSNQKVLLRIVCLDSLTHELIGDSSVVNAEKNATFEEEKNINRLFNLNDLKISNLNKYISLSGSTSNLLITINPLIYDVYPFKTKEEFQKSVLILFRINKTSNWLSSDELISYLANLRNNALNNLNLNDISCAYFFTQSALLKYYSNQVWNINNSNTEQYISLDTSNITKAWDLSLVYKKISELKLKGTTDDLLFDYDKASKEMIDFFLDYQLKANILYGYYKINNNNLDSNLEYVWTSEFPKKLNSNYNKNSKHFRLAIKINLENSNKKSNQLVLKNNELSLVDNDLGYEMDLSNVIEIINPQIEKLALLELKGLTNTFECTQEEFELNAFAFINQDYRDKIEIRYQIISSLEEKIDSKHWLNFNDLKQLIRINSVGKIPSFVFSNSKFKQGSYLVLKYISFNPKYQIIEHKPIVINTENLLTNVNINSYINILKTNTTLLRLSKNKLISSLMIPSWKLSDDSEVLDFSDVVDALESLGVRISFSSQASDDEFVWRNLEMLKYHNKLKIKISWSNDSLNFIGFNNSLIEFELKTKVKKEISINQEILDLVSLEGNSKNLIINDLSFFKTLEKTYPHLKGKLKLEYAVGSNKNNFSQQILNQTWFSKQEFINLFKNSKLNITDKSPYIFFRWVLLDDEIVDDDTYTLINGNQNIKELDTTKLKNFIDISSLYTQLSKKTALIFKDTLSRIKDVNGLSLQEIILDTSIKQDIINLSSKGVKLQFSTDPTCSNSDSIKSNKWFGDFAKEIFPKNLGFPPFLALRLVVENPAKTHLFINNKINGSISPIILANLESLKSYINLDINDLKLINFSGNTKSIKIDESQLLILKNYSTIFHIKYSVGIPLTSDLTKLWFTKEELIVALKNYKDPLILQREDNTVGHIKIRAKYELLNADYTKEFSIANLDSIYEFKHLDLLQLKSYLDLSKLYEKLTHKTYDVNLEALRKYGWMSIFSNITDKEKEIYKLLGIDFIASIYQENTIDKKINWNKSLTNFEIDFLVSKKYEIEIKIIVKKASQKYIEINKNKKIILTNKSFNFLEIINVDNSKLKTINLSGNTKNLIIDDSLIRKNLHSSVDILYSLNYLFLNKNNPNKNWFKKDELTKLLLENYSKLRMFDIDNIFAKYEIKNTEENKHKVLQPEQEHIKLDSTKINYFLDLNKIIQKLKTKETYFIYDKINQSILQIILPLSTLEQEILFQDCKLKLSFNPKLLKSSEFELQTSKKTTNKFDVMTKILLNENSLPIQAKFSQNQSLNNGRKLVIDEIVKQSFILNVVEEEEIKINNEIDLNPLKAALSGNTKYLSIDSKIEENIINKISERELVEKDKIQIEYSITSFPKNWLVRDDFIKFLKDKTEDLNSNEIKSKITILGKDKRRLILKSQPYILHPFSNDTKTKVKLFVHTNAFSKMLKQISISANIEDPIIEIPNKLLLELNSLNPRIKIMIQKVKNGVFKRWNLNSPIWSKKEIENLGIFKNLHLVIKLELKKEFDFNPINNLQHKIDTSKIYSLIRLNTKWLKEILFNNSVQNTIIDESKLEQKIKNITTSNLLQIKYSIDNLNWYTKDDFIDELKKLCNKSNKANRLFINPNNIRAKFELNFEGKQKHLMILDLGDSNKLTTDVILNNPLNSNFKGWIDTEFIRKEIAQNTLIRGTKENWKLETNSKYLKDLFSHSEFLQANKAPIHIYYTTNFSKDNQAIFDLSPKNKLTFKNGNLLAKYKDIIKNNFAILVKVNKKYICSTDNQKEIIELIKINLNNTFKNPFSSKSKLSFSGKQGIANLNITNSSIDLIEYLDEFTFEKRKVFLGNYVIEINVSDKKYSLKELEKISSDSTKWARYSPQNLPTNFYVGQYVMTRVKFHGLDYRFENLEILSSEQTEVKNLEIDLEKIFIELVEYSNFRKSKVSKLIDANSYISKLVIRKAANKINEGIKIELLTNLDYYYKNNKIALHPQTNMPLVKREKTNSFHSLNMFDDNYEPIRIYLDKNNKPTKPLTIKEDNSKANNNWLSLNFSSKNGKIFSLDPKANLEALLFNNQHFKLKISAKNKYFSKKNFIIKNYKFSNALYLYNSESLITNIDFSIQDPIKYSDKKFDWATNGNSQISSDLSLKIHTSFQDHELSGPNSQEILSQLSNNQLKIKMTRYGINNEFVEAFFSSDLSKFKNLKNNEKIVINVYSSKQNILLNFNEFIININGLYDLGPNINQISYLNWLVNDTKKTKNGNGTFKITLSDKAVFKKADNSLLDFEKVTKYRMMYRVWDKKQSIIFTNKSDKNGWSFKPASNLLNGYKIEWRLVIVDKNKTLPIIRDFYNSVLIHNKDESESNLKNKHSFNFLNNQQPYISLKQDNMQYPKKHGYLFTNLYEEINFNKEEAALINTLRFSFQGTNGKGKLIYNFKNDLKAQNLLKRKGLRLVINLNSKPISEKDEILSNGDKLDISFKLIDNNGFEYKNIDFTNWLNKTSIIVSNLENENKKNNNFIIYFSVSIILLIVVAVPITIYFIKKKQLKNKNK